MFSSIFAYEIKYWANNSSVYIYAAVAFLFGFVTMAGNAGVFGEASNETFRIANASYALYHLFGLFTKLALFIIPAIVGGSIYRDFKNNVFHILYSYPIKKSGYLSAKFLSSFCVVLFVALLFLSGCFAGTELPNTKAHLVTTFNISSYINLLITYLLPNLLLFSVISFALTLFSRSIYVGFIITVVIIILREILLRLTAGADANVFSLLVDPFAETATQYYTATWTIAEQNALQIPVGKFILLNRLLWLFASLMIAFLSFHWFRFSHQSVTLHLLKKRKIHHPYFTENSIIKMHLPSVLKKDTFLLRIKQAWLLSIKEFTSIIKTGAFISIVLAGILFVYVLLAQMNAPYGTKILPATWVMLAFPVLFFSLLINFVTFLYAGILVQRSRAHHMMQLVDTTAIRDWVLYLSKLFALAKLQATLLSIILAVGVMVQLTSGYYRIEFDHYLFDLFGIHLIGFVIWAFAALLIQTIFNNVWIGLFILILFYFGITELPLIGITNFIYRFNQNPDAGFYLQYAELSGYSHSLIPYFIYKSYWFCFGLFLFALNLLFWQRGISETMQIRLSTAWQRFRHKLFIPIISLLILFVSVGFVIYKTEMNSVKPISETQKEIIYREADNKYSKLQNLPQPRVISVDVNMDIYPEQQKFISQGRYKLVNKSNTEIDTLIVSTSLDVRTSFELSIPALIMSDDRTTGISILKLNKPLSPGDTIIFAYAVQSIPNTLFYENSLVKNNGTYITSLIYPSIGYRSSNFISNPDDTLALKNHYRSHDADYIDFKATISTSNKQMAIAPGYLVHHWKENDRNIFQYQSTTPVTNDYAFLSGEYTLTKNNWNDIDIKIYHDEKHTTNIHHMLNGIKATLAYCEKNYSDYQHKQIRIIEYSRSVGDFAQSFANTIPYSEIGFMLDIDEKGERGLNLPFIGVSHELAHQWWGMQAMPADVNGAKMITESMAEYVSLKVLEKEYGKAKALEFTEKAINTYIRNSLQDEAEELPLIYNSGNDKAHIPYQKGMLALNTMSHYLGEEGLNQTLKKYLSHVYLQTAPYTTSIEMIEAIKQVTPDSLKYLIHDLFEDVTHYDNKITDVRVAKASNEKYEVEVFFEVKKYRKVKSNWHEIPLTGELIEVGIYADKTERLPINVNSIRVTNIRNSVKLIIDKIPAKISLDPFLLLIDRNRNDNSEHI